jgi:Gpi18-like mannosyltransferase
MTPKKTLKVFFEKVQKQISFTDIVIILIGSILALLVRLSFHDYYTRDYTLFTKCYEALKHGGFVTFKVGCTNYSPIYEFLLYAETVFFPQVSNTAGPKILGIIFDFVCAGFAFLIVRLKYRDNLLPIFAYFAILFAPTMILNSAAWGQYDSIYTAFLLVSLYFALKEKGYSTCLFFGVAIAFKFQAVVLAPFLIALFLKRKIPFLALLVIPGVYLLSLLPGLLAGRSIAGLLTIYSDQVNLFNMLTLNAPSVYAWLPGNPFDQFYLGGLALAFSVCFLYLVAVYKSKSSMTPSLMVLLALVSALLVPFFLPRMHERYFLPADLITIVFAFYFPAFYYVPIVTNTVSFMAYLVYFFEQDVIPLPVLSLVEFAMIVIMVRLMFVKLYSVEIRLDEAANPSGAQGQD